MVLHGTVPLGLQGPWHRRGLVYFIDNNRKVTVQDGSPTGLTWLYREKQRCTTPEY